MIGKLLFGRKNGGFRMRYSSSEGQWQVYNEGNLIFVGAKESCENFVFNARMAFQKA